MEDSFEFNLSGKVFLTDHNRTDPDAANPLKG